ncbi:MAG: hypothetical protein LWY06_07925 [Firmicutes bacterium]|nr:hypothetical protein [Bacillota bacterium]
MKNYSEQSEKRNLPSNKGKFRFIMEESKPDISSGGDIPAKFFQGKQPAAKVVKAEKSAIPETVSPVEIIDRTECRKAFINEILPEIFHDVRSPMISWLSLFELMELDESVKRNIAEFTGDIGSEIKVVLRRIDHLETLFSTVLKTDKLTTGLKMTLAEIVDRVKDVLDMKIKRKKLNVAVEIDAFSDEAANRIHPSEFFLFIFELFYRLVEISPNKDTMVLKMIDNELVFSIGSCTEWEEKDTVNEPAFLPAGVKFKKLPYKGFAVSF